MVVLHNVQATRPVMLDSAVGVLPFSVDRAYFGESNLAITGLNFRAVFVSKSLIALVVLTTIFAVGRSISVIHGLDASDATRLLWSFEFRLLLAFWVHFDRQARGWKAPFEFDAFVFFAWPVALPYYLYRSRGWRGLLLSAGIVGGLYIVPALIAKITHLALTK